MVEYLLGLPGIIDPRMGDGTTALAVALARQDVKLLDVLFFSKHPSDINPQFLLEAVMFELGRELGKDHDRFRKALMRSTITTLRGELFIPFCMAHSSGDGKRSIR